MNWDEINKQLGYDAREKIKSILDSKEFKVTLYDGLDESKKIELGQFYTPAHLCIKMLDQFNCDTLFDKTILDPCVGSGNLLIACLIAGADSDKIFGNEYDVIAVDLCRKRVNRACDILGKLHIQDWQIHQGNALHEFALTYFDDDYETFYRADNYKRINHKNLKNIDNENWDAYIEPNFIKAHPDIYAKIIEQRIEHEKNKLIECVADCQTKEQIDAAESLDDVSLDFLATYGGNK